MVQPTVSFHKAVIDAGSHLCTLSRKLSDIIINLESSFINLHSYHPPHNLDKAILHTRKLGGYDDVDNYLQLSLYEIITKD